ncbi:hypothetical protein XENOCAPTIV_008705, partial [Xenoophorus captivus]
GRKWVFLQYSLIISPCHDYTILYSPTFRFFRFASKQQLDDKKHEHYSKHTSKLAMDKINHTNITRTEWYSHQPDLHPVGNLWTMPKRICHRKPTTTNSNVEKQELYFELSPDDGAPQPISKAASACI